VSRAALPLGFAWRRFLWWVIELNHALLSDLTTEGVPAVWGDVTREEILRAAALEDSPDIQILS
jgi:hypothetical protein